MINTLMRLSDKTLTVFALIVAAVASATAIFSVLDRASEVRTLATLDRPLPTVMSLETSDILERVEALSIFEEIIQYEREAENSGGLPTNPDAVDPEALLKPSAIVMQEDGITAFAFRDGIVMRFQEGDTVSGRTVVALSLSQIVFRDEDGQEETMILFGGNADTEGTDL